MSDQTDQPAQPVVPAVPAVPEPAAEERPKRRFRMPGMPSLPDLPDVPLLGKLKHVDEPTDGVTSPSADAPGPREGGRPRLPRLPELPDMPDIKELATHLSRLFPAPNPYLMEPWEVSLASLVDKVPHVPDIAVKALGLLDGFGAVHIGPQKLGFDGDEIEWDKVVALRTRRVSDMISGAVLEREVDRLRQYLPPVPGRKWAVSKAVDLLVVLSMVALEDQLEVVLGLVDGARGFDAATDQVTRDGRVVSEIVYKGWVRKEKELQAGLLASAVLAQVRGADHCLREMAAARGIPVLRTEDGNDLDDAAEKAAAIRRRIDELRAKIPMLRKDPDPTPDAEVEAGEQQAAESPHGPGSRGAPTAPAWPGDQGAATPPAPPGWQGAPAAPTPPAEPPPGWQGGPNAPGAPTSPAPSGWPGDQPGLMPPGAPAAPGGSAGPPPPGRQGGPNAPGTPTGPVPTGWGADQPGSMPPGAPVTPGGSAGPPPDWQAAPAAGPDPSSPSGQSAESTASTEEPA